MVGTLRRIKRNDASRIHEVVSVRTRPRHRNGKGLDLGRVFPPSRSLYGGMEIKFQVRRLGLLGGRGYWQGSPTVAHVVACKQVFQFF